MKDYSMARRGDWLTVATLVAQRLVNMNMQADDVGLDEDGKFGPLTEAAVRRFQKRTGYLVADGIVGPKTFAALGLKTRALHNVHLRSQRRGGLCWSAAASMLLGGIPPEPVEAKVNARGALVDTDANVEILGDELGWDYLPFATPDDKLVPALLRAPLWMGGDSVNTRGTADYIHALILGGWFAYEWGGGFQEVMKIFDPWPPGSGRIYLMAFDNPMLPGRHKFSVRWYLAPQIWIR
jgi:Putative peptidoglycan binding domain